MVRIARPPERNRLRNVAPEVVGSERRDVGRSVEWCVHELGRTVGSEERPQYRQKHEQADADEPDLGPPKSERLPKKPALSTHRRGQSPSGNIRRSHVGVTTFLSAGFTAISSVGEVWRRRWRDQPED